MRGFPITSIRSLLDASYKVKHPSEDSDIWCLNLDQIEPHSGKVISKLTVKASEVGSSTYAFEKGTVLYSKLRPYLNKVVVADADGMATTELVPLRCVESKVVPDYLAHFLRSPVFLAFATNVVAGAKMPRMVMGEFWAYPVPLPPLEEQRRIATILDQAETLRTQRRAALAQLDSLTQSIFLDMFGDPTSNPHGFETCLLGDIIEFVGGSQPAKEHFTFESSPDSIRLVQIRDFRTDEFKTYIPRKLARRLFETQDVMIGRYGPPVFQIFRGLAGSYNVALMKALPKPGVLRDFIFFLLQEPGLHGYVVNRSTRTAGQSGVNLDLLENYPVYRPPLALQQTFATRIQAIETLKATHRTALAELDTLFASLQQRAFSGELTKPASVAQNQHPKARDLSELCKFDVQKMLEAMLYVAKRMPEHNFYKSLKALYFADKHRLENHGDLIYGETYGAMDHGPVPLAAYEFSKGLNVDASPGLFAEDNPRATMRLDGHKLIPTRDADFGKLSSEERESLDWAIRYVAPMNFGDVKTASHDTAYNRTPSNQIIQLEHIIEMLPKAAKRKFFTTSR